MTEHFLASFSNLAEEQAPPGYLAAWTHQDAFEASRDMAESRVALVRFPWFKPAAHLTIDDRAMTFDGTFPEVSAIKAFQPWNKR
jgi:hypothetical protein